MNSFARASFVLLFAGFAIAGCKQSSETTTGEPKKDPPASSADLKKTGPGLEGVDVERQIAEIDAILDEAKRDKAKLDAVMIEQTIKVWFIKNDGTFPDSLDALVKPPKSKFYLERGPDALLDPWGKKYQFKIGKDAEKQPTIEIWTIAPDGTRIDNARKKGVPLG